MPTYRHDVFISYRQVDNKPMVSHDDESRWVSRFAGDLQTRLDIKFGGTGAGQIWIDYEDIKQYEKVTPSVEQAVRGAATLVVILSRGYKHSEWCQQERDFFLEEQRADPQRRIFLVQYDMLPRKTWPVALQDLIGYEFFAIDQGGRPRTVRAHPAYRSDLYYQRVDDLAYDLFAHINAQRESHVTPDLAPSPQVFLAEVPPGLSIPRDRVKRSLLEVGVEVLPTRWYPSSPETMRQEMEADMRRCVLFVQLLGGGMEFGPDYPPAGYDALQHTVAREIGIPIKRWRDPDQTAVGDLDDGGTIIEETIHEFTRIVGEHVQAELRKSQLVLAQPKVATTTRAPVDTHSFFFVNGQDVDEPLLRFVVQQLESIGLCYFLLPEDELTLETLTETQCRGVIIVYGKCPVTWVRTQLLMCLRVMSRDASQVHAVYDGPPLEKAAVSCNVPHVHLLDCRGGLDERALQAFLEDLRKVGAS